MATEEESRVKRIVLTSSRIGQTRTKKAPKDRAHPSKRKTEQKGKNQRRMTPQG